MRNLKESWRNGGRKAMFNLSILTVFISINPIPRNNSPREEINMGGNC